MKALREQNIVHRDLKPGNILIKKDPVTGKMKASVYTCNCDRVHEKEHIHTYTPNHIHTYTIMI